ncbi:hypothetical protein J2Z21_008601 [Streptomyces griseochromogenes]|uniref:DNA-binding domain-containing protein n=1 Tax=Streptomyces griseochromogenes TaxID=68214 RepID=A0ABS4M7C9_9ACTN|nr:helix-turn-helix domain-containing protein [Streptomyces griseochromogenes]MBP2055585.1 hypothetical protein [Streptomyces griseochromogenes]
MTGPLPARVSRTWRDRFAQQGLPGLVDRKRTGRPPAFSPLQAAKAEPAGERCLPFGI